MKIVLCLLLSSAIVTAQSVAASSLSECFSLCRERKGRCLAECFSYNHLERRQGGRRGGRGRRPLGPPRRGGPQFGTRRGADTKNNAAARQQDQQDSNANVKADAGARTAATGGVGGVDPATGETLFALPDASQFCKDSGQTLADGTQISSGFCSSLPQGQVPAVENMVSTIIVEPANLANLAVGAAFDVKIQTKNMETGFFTVAATEYYTQPQTLNAQGAIKGHQHITIQRLASLTTAPNAQEKDFFKGVNSAAAADGTSVVPVPAGTLTTPGTYRICSMTGSFSHQPLIMPIAQRGAQDDCIRVTVGNAGGGNGGNRGNGGNGGGRNQQGRRRGRGRLVKRYDEGVEDDEEGVEYDDDDDEGEL